MAELAVTAASPVVEMVMKKLASIHLVAFSDNIHLYLSSKKKMTINIYMIPIYFQPIITYDLSCAPYVFISNTAHEKKEPYKIIYL